MKEVERYYDENAQAEWERLEKHPMEFALTMRALREHLLPKSRILDIGGARSLCHCPCPVGAPSDFGGPLRGQCGTGPGEGQGGRGCLRGMFTATP